MQDRLEKMENVTESHFKRLKINDKFHKVNGQEGYHNDVNPS